MAELFDNEERAYVYWDRKQFTHFEDQVKALHGSKFVYIGNLGFQTTEGQIHEYFSKVGPVKRVIMGLNRFDKTPCGFCFVEYPTHQCALDAVAFLHGTQLDARVIRVELDWGYTPARRYGRGEHGGQVRDEKRTEYDPGRGGYGRKYIPPPEALVDMGPVVDPVSARRHQMKDGAEAVAPNT